MEPAAEPGAPSVSSADSVLYPGGEDSRGPETDGVAAGALDDELTPLPKEYWGPLASLILPLLLVEWFWFHHRT